MQRRGDVDGISPGRQQQHQHGAAGAGRAGRDARVGHVHEAGRAPVPHAGQRGLTGAGTEIVETEIPSLLQTEDGGVWIRLQASEIISLRGGC